MSIYFILKIKERALQKHILVYTLHEIRINDIFINHGFLNKLCDRNLQNVKQKCENDI